VDYSLFKDVNGLSGSQPFDSIMKFAASDLIYVAVVIVALAFLIPGRWAAIARRRGAVAATLSAGLALLVAVVVAHIVDRARPFVSHPGKAHLLVAHARDAGFPSEHATGAFGLAMGMCLYCPPLGVLLFVIAAVIAFSRVYVGVHYPADVIAGALLGAAAALVLYLPPLRRLIERFADFAAGIGDGLLGRGRRAGAGA
jgi:undecaprenyl-diphosphatase